MNDGTAVENIDIKMKLSVMKPLHASWIIELYNYMTSGAGREVCINGWKRSGISDAIQKGVNDLPTLDPFDDIDPLVEEVNVLDIVYDESSLATNKYITQYESNSDSEWEDEDGNIFDRLNNEDVYDEENE